MNLNEDIYRRYRGHVIGAVEELRAEGSLPADLDSSRVTVEPPREAGHGDLSTNAAMVLARQAGRKPLDLADMLAVRLGGVAGVTGIDIAGPGFINMSLDRAVWTDRLTEILRAGTAYGDRDVGAGRTVNVEFVSANPTGPLHIAHGRGAVVGDVVASLLEKGGYAVVREYYTNDAGAQVDVLARSAFLRYCEALGRDVGEIPEGLYPGDYLKEVGEALAERHGDKWLDRPEAEWLADIRGFAVNRMMELIRADLQLLGIEFDVIASERALVDQGRVADAVAFLEARDLTHIGVLEPPKGKLPDDWEQRPQTLFKSKQFGDDTDRPLVKSDGTWTYFASDIAYHLDKAQRGAADMIDVWGADHAGYIKRMKAAVKAVTEGEGNLDVLVCQLVTLMRDGKEVRMSKRAGAFVTLREVIESVGKDVLRFIMLTRRNDQPLEFDLSKVLEQSKDNPVFYVQYAHARCCSVMNRAGKMFGEDNITDSKLSEVDLTPLSDPGELSLIKLMASWPRLVEAAVDAREPHRICFYLQELASAFHGFWHRGNENATLRFINLDDQALAMARLALARGVATVIASGLAVLGVEPVKEMREDV